jgi:signal transduction histidine kinase
MSERAWYRSLYWRIAVGFILFLGAMLVAQAGLFLWMAIGSSTGGLSPGAMDDLSRVVAADLAGTLARDPALDVDAHLRDRYGDVAALIVVVFRDGRVASTGDREPPEALVRMAAARLRRPRLDRPGWTMPGPRPPSIGMAPVRLGGPPAAMVLVVRERPMGPIVREFGPVLLLGAGLLLASGTGLAAMLIFRPAHRRLRALEEATARLRLGDLGARAPVDGGDEISNVAMAFNRMADDLERREADLRVADRTRRQLLADVSHELMTPLTAIRGYLETLRMADLPIEAATRDRYLRIVSDETQRLEQLTGDLLELARFEAGGITLEIGDVCIADLFARVGARHEREVHARSVSLVTTVGAGAERIAGDADRLEQALQNLTANALRHVPDGGRVVLDARAVDAGIQLSVEDSGAGIPAEHLPHVFDRFYKADASRAGSAGGSGLGLSIVKAIVELHGGTVGVRSEPGVETVFEIRLPRRP